MTGTMTSSISAVDAMMRLRCWTATSPDGSMTTMPQPESSPETAMMVRTGRSLPFVASLGRWSAS